MKRTKSSDAAGKRVKGFSANWPFLRAGRLFLLSGLMLAIALAAFFLHQGSHRSNPENRSVATTGARHSTSQSRTNYAQPWGDLEIKSITLERPDEFVPDLSEFKATQVWFFGGYSRERLLTLFRDSDLTESQHAQLEDPTRWKAATNGYYVLPDSQLVLQLSKKARQQIYQVLAEFGENPFQSHPFTFPKNRESEWFAESGLSPDTLALVNQLLYEQDKTLCFSDMDILASLKSEEEKHRLIRTLSRVPAVLASLRVTSPTNINDLVRYWGRARPSKDIEPLLESMARLPQGSMVSVAYLLPPFARLHLYTYPESSANLEITGQDCFWTALNFFNTEADDRFLDPAQRDKVLRHDYIEITPPPMLGDILLLVNAQGTPIYACVYVAADVVFTKNGGTKFSPWILMQLRDLLDFYASQKPTKQVFLRKKDHT